MIYGTVKNRIYGPTEPLDHAEEAAIIGGGLMIDWRRFRRIGDASKRPRPQGVVFFPHTI
jgi:hypothetical protein